MTKCSCFINIIKNNINMQMAPFLNGGNNSLKSTTQPAKHRAQKSAQVTEKEPNSNNK